MKSWVGNCPDWKSESQGETGPQEVQDGALPLSTPYEHLLDEVGWRLAHSSVNQHLCGKQELDSLKAPNSLSSWSQSCSFGIIYTHE